MKRVWKCDFCSKANIDPDLILNHEKTCTFNPATKTCYTCKHRYHLFDSVECEIKLDVLKGEDYGNCEGWSPSDIKEYRKIKLNNLNNVSFITLER